MKNKIITDKPKAKGILTVIEFSAQRIKLAQSSFVKKRRIITRLFIKDNIPDSEHEFINALERIIKINHLKIDNLLISLDRSLVTIRFIKLPCVNEEEISNMAEWQAVKFLPYKIDEIVVSHQTIRVDADGFSHVILVIVPKSTIRKFTNICDVLKLHPRAITLSSEGLLKWYVDFQSDADKDSALALVDIDKDSVELVIIYQERFLFSRSLVSSEIEGDDQSKERIINEIKISINSYSKQESSVPIKKIILTGNKSQVSNLAPLFKDEFDTEVVVIDQLKNLNLKDVIGEPSIIQDTSFASICGLALNQKLTQIDLLMQENKDKIAYLENRKKLFKTISLALFAALVICGIFTFNFYSKKKIINTLDRQLKKITPAAMEIQDIKNKIAIINTCMDNKGSCLEVLREIYSLTPKNTYLNTLIFQEANEVILKGTAPAMSSVFSFTPILNESLLFKNVEVRYVTQRKTQTGELTDFEIICKLTSSPRDK